MKNKDLSHEEILAEAESILKRNKDGQITIGKDNFLIIANPDTGIKRHVGSVKQHPRAKELFIPAILQIVIYLIIGMILTYMWYPSGLPYLLHFNWTVGSIIFSVVLWPIVTISLIGNWIINILSISI